MSDWKNLKAQMLADPEFRAYCEERQVDTDIANALTRRRYEQGLSREELAAKSGVPVRQIKKFEDLDKLPSLKTLKRLADALGCTVRVEFVQKGQIVD